MDRKPQRGEGSIASCKNSCSFYSVSVCSTLFAAPPNIILIMADDFGYECVTANGGESYKTPNLDRLAAGGMRFEHAHSQPLCTPTRVQLMTGKYNVRNYLNFGTLVRTETTFGHLFQKAGYATGVCGKWQLGREPDSPQHFGFDEALLWQHTCRPPRYANAGLELNGVEKEYPEGATGRRSSMTLPSISSRGISRSRSFCTTP